MIGCNLGRSLPHFRDIAGFLLKTANLYYSTCKLRGFPWTRWWFAALKTIHLITFEFEVIQLIWPWYLNIIGGWTDRNISAAVSWCSRCSLFSNNFEYWVVKVSTVKILETFTRPYLTEPNFTVNTVGWLNMPRESIYWQCVRLRGWYIMSVTCSKFMPDIVLWKMFTFDCIVTVMVICILFFQLPNRHTYTISLHDFICMALYNGTYTLLMCY